MVQYAKKSIQTYLPASRYENRLCSFPSKSVTVKSTAVVKVVWATILEEVLASSAKAARIIVKFFILEGLNSVIKYINFKASKANKST